MSTTAEEFDLQRNHAEEILPEPAEENLLEEMVFNDTDPKEVPVKIKVKGVLKEYRLKEANTDAATKYRNAVIKCARLGPEGKPQLLDGAADAEALLVSMCLFEVIDTGPHKGKLGPVSLGFVRTLPPHVTEGLYARAKRISRLDVEEETIEGLEKQAKEIQKKLARLRAKEEQEKNSSNATTGYSA